MTPYWPGHVGISIRLWTKVAKPWCWAMYSNGTLSVHFLWIGIHLFYNRGSRRS